MKDQTGYASGVEAEVCADIAARQQKGISKYGKTVAENPLSLEQWLQHAYEECLDQAIYLKKAIAVTKTQDRRSCAMKIRRILAIPFALAADIVTLGNMGDRSFTQQLFDAEKKEKENEAFLKIIDGYLPCLASVVHLCPPAGSGVMLCCGRTPFNVPYTDRMTTDRNAVTCNKFADKGNRQKVKK